MELKKAQAVWNTRRNSVNPCLTWKHDNVQSADGQQPKYVGALKHFPCPYIKGGVGKVFAIPPSFLQVIIVPLTL